ncbi:Putative ribonuclease H protein At1g65750 [Linum perenne]
MGFSYIWIEWIKAIITTVRFSVLINRNATQYFEPTRGLRQDDTLVFGKATVKEAMQIQLIFLRYSYISGQTLNEDKSSLMFSTNTPNNIKDEISSILNVAHGNRLGKYLGMPAEWGSSKVDTFSFLLERLHNKAQSWTSLLLSHGGREILCKSVLQSIPSYIFSCFLLPDKLLNKMDNLVRRYWWSGDPKRRAIHWCAANRMNAAKSWTRMYTLRRNHFGWHSYYLVGGRESKYCLGIRSRDCTCFLLYDNRDILIWDDDGDCPGLRQRRILLAANPPLVADDLRKIENLRVVGRGIRVGECVVTNWGRGDDDDGDDDVIVGSRCSFRLLTVEREKMTAAKLEKFVDGDVKNGWLEEGRGRVILALKRCRMDWLFSWTDKLRIVFCFFLPIYVFVIVVIFLIYLHIYLNST